MDIASSNLFNVSAAQELAGKRLPDVIGNDTNNPESHKVSISTIAGATAGGVAGLAILIMLLALYIRRSPPTRLRKRIAIDRVYTVLTRCFYGLQSREKLGKSRITLTLAFPERLS